MTGKNDDPRSSRNTKTSVSKKYETSKDVKNLDLNTFNRKSDSIKNEKENLKNNLLKKKTEVLEKYNPNVKQGKIYLILRRRYFQCSSKRLK
jgi:hypothetical protein